MLKRVSTFSLRWDPRLICKAKSVSELGLPVTAADTAADTSNVATKGGLGQEMIAGLIRSCSNKGIIRS